MAHIERRESGGWRARYRAPEGRERSRTFARKVDAQRFLAGVETDKSRGEWIDPRLGRTRVDDFAGRWMTAVAPTLKPKTVATYESLLRSRVQPVFGDWSMASIRPSDVQAWVGEMLEEGLSPSRIRQAHVVLSLVLQAAVRDGVVVRNVASGVRLPKLAREEAPYFDPATVDRIVAAMPEPYDLLVRILGTLGPRWGEAAALRRSSVDLLRRRLRIVESATEVGGRLVHGRTKSYGVRQVPLTPALLAKLGTHLAGVAPDPEAPLFVSPAGGPLRHSNFYHRLLAPDAAEPRPSRDRAPRAAPLGRGPHDRRRRVAQGGPGGARAPLGGVHPDRLRAPLRRRSRRPGRPSRRQYGPGSQNSRGLTAA